MSKHFSAPKKYLPLENFHIVEVSSLLPNDLKKAAKKAKTDREKISHTTILNAVSKALGIKGGFSNYAKEYKTHILPFMEKNELITHSNIFNAREAYYSKPFRDLNSQSVSERLFLSGRQFPQKIFTGYNVNYYDDLFDKDMFDNKIFDFRHPALFLQSTVNLIGDTLIYPVNSDPVVQLYFPNDSPTKDKNQEKELNKYKETTTIFRNYIDKDESGWVEVIPYNDSLCFLRGVNGEYDFVFKKLRSYKFEHKFLDNTMKIGDVPFWVDNYHFDRWDYFVYAGWREKRDHDAENYFYSSGGSIASYPGEMEIKKSYCIKFEKYVTKKQHTAKNAPPSFKNTVLGSSTIAISNLVSIADFTEFLNESHLLDDSQSAQFYADNSDTNKCLPATVSFNDILLYTKWYSDTKGHPVRLLALSEYQKLRSIEHVAMNKNYDSSDIIFYDENNVPYGKNNGFENHPPHMHPDHFAGIKYQFNDSIKEVESTSGFSFVDSNFFAEWVMEKTCIRSGNMKSFYGTDYIIREQLPLDCAGRYKHLKIGFRLCIDIDS